MNVLFLLAMAVSVGILLGLFGGGGSVIAVPVLIYLLGYNPPTAITYSLFIVGTSALVGNIIYFRQRQVHFMAGLTFVLPSIAAVFLVRKFVLPRIPNIVGEVAGIVVLKDNLILCMFSLLMVLSGLQMIRNKNQEETCEQTEGKGAINIPVILLIGIVVGTLTGLVGSGGGFLIVPSLVLFAAIPLKRAIGTSLLIICINSEIGFLTDVWVGAKINWQFLLPFSMLAFLGVVIGALLSKKIHVNNLRPLFGWFELVVGILIVFKQLFFSK